MADQQVLLNSLLTFFHHFRVPETSDHLPQNHDFGAVGVDLRRFLDGLAFAGVSSCEVRGGKWRVIATILLRTHNGLELYVAENTKSDNALYDVPKHFQAIWDLLRDLALTDFDVQSSSPPPEVTQLLKELRVRYLAFALPRLRHRVSKYADQFCAAISSYLETVDAGGSESLVPARLTEIRACVTRVHNLLSSLQLAARFSKPYDGFDMARLLPEDRDGLHNLWRELENLRQSTSYTAAMGPESVFKDCELFFIAMIRKNSKKTDPMARYVKKLLSYVAVYYDFVLFAHGSEMRAFKAQTMTVNKSMVVGSPLTPTFEFDLNNVAFATHCDRAFGPGQSSALRSDPEFVGEESRLRKIVQNMRLGDDSKVDVFDAMRRGTLAPTLAHCESVLARTAKDMAEKGYRPVYYIGVSKPSCLPCLLYTTTLGDFKTGGTHGAVDIPWSTPSGESKETDARILADLTTSFVGILSSYGAPGPTSDNRRDSGSTAISFRDAPCVHDV